SMNDERWDSDLGKVFPEVSAPCGHARVRCGGTSVGRRGPACVDGLLADARPEIHVCVVEVLEEIREPGVPVCGDRFLYTIEDALVNAFGIVGRLQQVRWDASSENSLSDTLRSVVADVTCDLSSTHAESDQ